MNREMNKFSYVLMNPPYANTGMDVLHLKFVDKCLNIARKLISIFPYTFISKSEHKQNNSFKERFSKYLIYVEEISSNIFVGTSMPNVGIYYFNDEKDTNSQILVKNQKGQNTYYLSLLDIKTFSNYEQLIINYLDSKGSQEIFFNRAPTFEKAMFKLKKYFDKGYNAALIVNHDNGGMNGTFMSRKIGQIFDNYQEFEKFFSKNNKIYNILFFNSVKSAENCKNALNRSLLRFTCYRLLSDLHMTFRVYKYIPAIDWEDERCLTDEGILEMCGCPADKAKEYAEYCKDIIEKVDKGERP